MNQETEPGQERVEETDALPRSQNAANCIRSRNHSNLQKCPRGHEASAGGNDGGRTRVPHQCLLQDDQDEGLEIPQSQQIQPIPRPAVTYYRRQGDSEARAKRYRRRQQRDTERVHSIQQGKQHHGEISLEDDPVLASSSGTEKGFQSHNNQGALERSDVQDDTRSYDLQLQSEQEGFIERADAEQQQLHLRSNYPPELFSLLCQPLPDSQNPQGVGEAQEILNNVYSTYVYTQSPNCSERSANVSAGQNLEPIYTGFEVYSGSFENSLSDRVYEEVCPVSVSSSAGGANDRESPQHRNLSIQQLQRQPGDGDYHQREAVGSRLHHYAQCSDGESDSPEKEAEFALYPPTDSCDHDEDVDSNVAEVKESLRSQSLHCTLKDITGKEQELTLDEKRPQSEIQTSENSNHKVGSQEVSARDHVVTSPEESVLVRDDQKKKDAISLSIKDIKEAIEEVKTRTVKSPYTPDEPKEPIWVMRQDFSHYEECGLQPFLGNDVSADTMIIIVVITQ